MNSLFLAWIIGLGVWVVADGMASLWTYHNKPNETFWRNQSFRVFRMIVGVLIILLASLVLKEVGYD